jgi:tetratricopeptide (TPR) repeat protein
MRQGAAAFRRGDYAAAERDWRTAAARCRAANDVDGELDALANLGVVWQQLGDYGKAIDTLCRAAALAEASDRTHHLARIENALGVAFTFRRDYPQANSALTRARSYAERVPADPELQAGIRLNLANLLAASAVVAKNKADRPRNYEGAFAEYEAAGDLARRSGHPALAAQADVDAAFTGVRAGNSERAEEFHAR